MNRIFIIILDGVGIGELPDAGLYGDQGSNTLANLAKVYGNLNLPNLEKLGLGKIYPIQGLNSELSSAGAYGKMAEQSMGKDSTTGHWEIAGIKLEAPFPTYPQGFPDKILTEFEEKIGRKTLGNYPASGTEILKLLGEEHLKTGQPIVYTSADSVFQIAAHEDLIPLEQLYHFCQVAREILRAEHAVARVIARPFVGESKDSFKRTVNRRDFSLKPFSRTMHLILQENRIKTVAIGKIDDLYAGSGIDEVHVSKSNHQGMEILLKARDEISSGLIMANLVDFDMLFGHRNDVNGFAGALQEFDSWLPEFGQGLTGDDMVILTADHGNDPTTPSTDHSREYVPLLVYGPGVKQNIDLGTRSTFADVQATVCENFGLAGTGFGNSFLSEIIKGYL